MKKHNRLIIFQLFIFVSIFLSSCDSSSLNTNSNISLKDIRDFNNSPYVELNNNIPEFTADEKTSESFERYSELDSLGRCQVAFANISKELMPKSKREGIGMIKPSGWKTIRYDDIIEDKYLYNRCHLIGFQLAGENANEKNLITGTRYLNVVGMLPFENKVADYVKSTGNHVLYRVTPVFDGNNLIASGVKMEAYSVEDKGKGISFNVYCYNNQPGVIINYANGDSKKNIDESESLSKESFYIINTNTKKYHITICSSISKIKSENKVETNMNKESLEKQGYSPCGTCTP